jgi:hypothetical protein
MKRQLDSGFVWSIIASAALTFALLLAVGAF